MVKNGQAVRTEPAIKNEKVVRKEQVSGMSKLSRSAMISKIMFLIKEEDSTVSSERIELIIELFWLEF